MTPDVAAGFTGEAWTIVRQMSKMALAFVRPVCATIGFFVGYVLVQRSGSYPLTIGMACVGMVLGFAFATFLFYQKPPPRD